MGKGIALQFRREFTEDYFKDYKRACQSGELAIGKVHVYELKNAGNQFAFYRQFSDQKSLARAEPDRRY